jgi:hypothetical protein
VHDQIRFAAKGIISYWYYHSVGVRDGMCATATKGTKQAVPACRKAGALVRLLSSRSAGAVVPFTSSGALTHQSLEPDTRLLHLYKCTYTGRASRAGGVVRSGGLVWSPLVRAGPIPIGHRDLPAFPARLPDVADSARTDLLGVFPLVPRLAPGSSAGLDRGDETIRAVHAESSAC